MSQHKEPRPASGIVTSSDSSGVRRLPYLWLGMGIVVAIAIAGLAVWAIKERHSHVTNNPSSTSATSSLMTNQQRLDAALSAAQQRLAEAKTASDKANAYSAVGTAYFNKGNYGSAATAYTNAIGSDSSSKIETLPLLAYTYATAGHRSQAIQAYQELITLLQQQPGATDNMALQGTQGVQGAITAYQHDIQVLQQGGSL